MQCNAMQCNAMQCDAMRCNAMRCDAMQCDAMRCNAMQCNEMQCNAMQCNEMKCNAMQWNEMKWNEMKCNAMQYNTIPLYRWYITMAVLNMVRLKNLRTGNSLYILLVCDSRLTPLIIRIAFYCNMYMQLVLVTYVLSHISIQYVIYGRNREQYSIYSPSLVILFEALCIIDKVLHSFDFTHWIWAFQFNFSCIIIPKNLELDVRGIMIPFILMIRS